MGEPWVVDASPWIVLGAVGQLPLLDALAGDVVVPEAVRSEVLAGPDDAGRRAMLSLPIQTRSDPVTPDIAEWGLGAGESAVLASARAIGGRAVLDDRAGRLAARALEIPVIGTLGVVARARRVGVIGAAAPVLEAVRMAGLFVEEALLAQILVALGEQAKDE